MKPFWILVPILFFSSLAFSKDNIYYQFDFGSWFGGDKIAENPGGDNYNAGSGAVLGLGIDWKFSQKYKLYFRNNFAYRYQGAKVGNGGNSGLVYETALVKQWGRSKLVGGFHYDINAVTKDQFGNKIKYEDSVGTYVGYEYMAFETWGLGVKYLIQDYDLSTNETVSGDQIGLFVTGWFRN